MCFLYFWMKANIFCQIINNFNIILYIDAVSQDMVDIFIEMRLMFNPILAPGKVYCAAT